MASINEIRKNFIDYFAKNGHTHIPSSPLIPHNDPSLLFTNSGMVQFKNYFTGKEIPKFSRAVSAQKCVRAGGKHNDLDNVGYTARHHTFFEMLGNFSFGDYFKEQAIFHAWEVITKIFGLPPEKLYVTVFHTDLEAINLWKKISGLGDERILKIQTSDNFWSMGENGPCGPCTEIFYDHGENVKGGLPGTPDQDGDRYIEIWNLVFMQFEQINSTRIPLKNPSIDTGMGLERITAVLQNVHNNYEIDLFKNLIGEIEDKLNAKYEGNASHKVIADHLRSISFLIADGVMPSNEGRGYVLRRIMRRAMRHANLLGVTNPVLYELTNALIREMGGSYPELSRAESLIKDVIKLEEEKFLGLLKRGLKTLNEELAKNTGNIFSGESAFKLYDTYGFPLDLTIDILREKNISVDLNAFNDFMEKQKNQARLNWLGSGEKQTDKLWFEISGKVGITEFVGYEHNHIEANITAIIEDNKEMHNFSHLNKEVNIICNQTPFYAESGGQIGDSGFMYNDLAKLKVIDTKKILGNIYLHICKLISGTINLNDSLILEIDVERRKNIRANHSATHILHFILRKILGPHVTQKGSHVDDKRLRFDFSHNKALTFDEITNIECQVNKIIQNNYKAVTKIMNNEEAIKLGAMALFGEKYEEEVRVVSFEEIDNFNICRKITPNGVQSDIFSESNNEIENFSEGNFNDKSIELCGGTHVNRSGDIGFFKIISENAIASGIRRIEAVTGEIALKYVQDQEKIIDKITNLFKCHKDEILTKIEIVMNDKKKAEKSYQLSEMKYIISNISPEYIMEVPFIYIDISENNISDVKNLIDNIQDKYKSSIILCTSINGEKISIICAITNDLVDKLDANLLVKEAVNITGGKGGGGRNNYAQGGGVNKAQLPGAIYKLKEMIQLALR